MHIGFSTFLAFFGTRYLMVAVAIAFTIHFWVVGRLGKKSESEFSCAYPTSWLNRYPLVMIGLLLLAESALLYGFNHLRPEYQMSYYNMLVVGAPFLATWYTLLAISLMSISAIWMYRRRAQFSGGALTFASILLLALVAPYHFPF